MTTRTSMRARAGARWRRGTPACASVFFTLGIAASLPLACGDNDNFASVDDGGGEGSVLDGSKDATGDAGIDAPPGCDLTKDPKDSPACVDNSVGIFVDSTGSDGNPGTKASPVQTVTKGLALAKSMGLPRIYVCEATYAEDVSLSQSTSVYGGWKCGDWSYSGNKAKVGKTALAAHVDSVTSPVVLADLNIVAAAATAPGGSSIGVLVNASSDVTLLRDAIQAQAGKDGMDAVQKAQAAKAADGVSSTGNAGGAQCKNTCADGDSIGGKGGDVGSANAVDGQPSYGGAYPNNGGHGMDSTGCLSGGAGGTGAPPTTTGADQPGATAYGTLTPAMWSPASGTPGTAGVRGQGGGGGGARAGGGGGGACGGCGGSGGDPGAGGGGSFGVVSVASTVKLRSSGITTGVAGRGGAGALGQLGQMPGAGGNGFTASPSGCGGGDGSQGSQGGAGGGGAGGLSVGVFYKGTMPDADMSTIGAIVAGAKGTGGAGGAANNGVDGKSAATLECKAPACM